MNYWNDEEDELLKSVYGQKTIFEIVPLFPKHTRGSIYKRAKKIGLTSKENYGKLYRKYSVNQGFFSEKTPEALYWAGFIAADGYVDDKRDHSLTITLAKKDEDHIKLFCKEVEYSGPLNYG